MRDELNAKDLGNVSGGRYIINGNTHQIGFRDANQMFNLSSDCTDYQVMEVCDSFIGKFSTEEEYDNACIAALKARNWI